MLPIDGGGESGRARRGRKSHPTTPPKERRRPQTDPPPARTERAPEDRIQVIRRRRAADLDRDPKEVTSDPEASREVTRRQAGRSAELTGPLKGFARSFFDRHSDGSPNSVSGSEQDSERVFGIAGQRGRSEPEESREAASKEDPSEFREAAEVLNRHYSVFDNPDRSSSQGKSGSMGDGVASKADFEKLAEGDYDKEKIREYLTESGLSGDDLNEAVTEIENSAKFFVENETYFRVADTINDGKKLGDGDADGNIRSANANLLWQYSAEHDAALAKHGKTTEVTNPGQAAEILEGFLPLADSAQAGTGATQAISAEDLRALMSSEDVPDAVKMAAEYLIPFGSRELLDPIERADNGKSDGQLNFSEIRATAKEYREMSPEMRGMLEEHEVVLRDGEEAGFFRITEDGTPVWRDSGKVVKDEEISTIQEAIGDEKLEKGFLGAYLEGDMNKLASLAAGQVKALDDLSDDISPISESIDKENENYARYLTENQALLSESEKLKLEKEHQTRVDEQKAKLEAEADKLIEEANDPEFRKKFASFPKEKQELFFETLEQVAETDAADEFVQQFVEDYGSENKENPYAVVAGRITSTGDAGSKLRQGVTSITTSRLIRDIDKGGSVEDAVAALERAGGEVPPNLKESFAAFASAEDGPAYKVARAKLAEEISDLKGDTKFAKAFDVFAPAAAALDLYQIAKDPSSVTDPKMILQLAADSADTSAIILKRAAGLTGAANMASKANLVATAGLSLIELYGDLREGDAVGVVANSLTAAGAGLSMTVAGTVPGVAMMAAGATLNLLNTMGAFERDQYNEFKIDQNDSIGLDQELQGEWVGERSEFQEEFLGPAEERGLTVIEAYTIYREVRQMPYVPGDPYLDDIGAALDRGLARR